MTSPSPQMNFTERELDVLRLIAKGMTNRQIADELIIGTETVRWYTKQIYSKMGVHSRTQASMKARDMGLFSELQESLETGSEVAHAHNNLPLYHTSFIGREDEFNDVRHLILRGDVRLVTITGPGGIGKSRLSVEVARKSLDDFPDGVVFVSLLSIEHVEELVAEVARSLDLRVSNPDETADTILHYLQSKQLLLILDNVEETTGASEWVAMLLDTAPKIVLLVTSRSKLNLRGEWVRQVDGMTQQAQNDAIALFHDRVKQVRTDFSLEDNIEHVREICRLVQGMPLAIELATAGMTMLTIEDVVREIKKNVDFLQVPHRDVEERHRSIRAVFEYSWEYLTDAEKRVFRRLSVFRGGFGLKAAEQVAGASVQVLVDLANKSLLYRNADGLYAIHDLLRQYAEERLVNSEATSRSQRSNALIAWTALFNGDFRRVRAIAEKTVEANSDNLSTNDKAFGLAVLGVVAGIEEDYSSAMQLSKAALPLIEDDPITVIVAHLGMGIANCGRQDYASAQQHARIALNQANELHVPAFVTLIIPVLAIIRAHEAEAEKALEMIALAKTHQASVAGWVQYWPLFQQLDAEIRQEFEPETYETVWARGKAIKLETLIDLI